MDVLLVKMVPGTDDRLVLVPGTAVVVDLL